MASNNIVSLEDLLNSNESPPVIDKVEVKSTNTPATVKPSFSDPLAVSGSENLNLNVTEMPVQRHSVTGNELIDNAIKQNLNKTTKEDATSKTEENNNYGKKTLKDYQNKKESSDESSTNFRILLATMKAYRPLISAATYSPGVNGTGGEMGGAVTLMAQKTAELTDELCKLCDVDRLDPDSQWKVSGLREHAAEQIALQWKNHVSKGVKDFDIKSSITGYSAAMESLRVFPDNYKYPQMSETIRLQLSVMKSIMPVIKEFNLMEDYMAKMFNGFKFKKEIFENISNQMFDEVMIFVNKSSLAPGDDNAKLIMFQACLNHAGDIYAHAVASAMDAIVSDVSKMDTRSAQKHLFDLAKRNNALIDFKPINDEFKRDFSVLTKIAMKSPIDYASKSAFTG